MQIVINNYNTKKSLMHKIHPTVKIIIVFFIMSLSFASHSIFVNILIISIIAVLWICARKNIIQTIRLLFTIFVFFLIILLINWIVMKSPGVVVYNDEKIQTLYISRDAFPRINTLTNATNISDKYRYLIGEGWGLNIQEIPIIYHKSHTSETTFESLININREYTGVGKIYEGYTTVIANIQNTDSIIAIFYLPKWYTLSKQSLFYSLNISFKVLQTIAIIDILVSTTSNVELTYGISNFLTPLKIFGAPINEWSMIISLAVRFIPSLLSESEKILNAQASRGVDFKNGNQLQKGKALLSLIIPIFLIAFIKSNDLAAAMDVRCYNPRNLRTRFKTFRIRFVDILLLIFLSTIIGIIIMFISTNVLLSIFAIPDLILTFGKL